MAVFSGTTAGSKSSESESFLASRSIFASFVNSANASIENSRRVSSLLIGIDVDNDCINSLNSSYAFSSTFAFHVARKSVRVLSPNAPSSRSQIKSSSPPRSPSLSTACSVRLSAGCGVASTACGVMSVLGVVNSPKSSSSSSSSSSFELPVGVSPSPSSTNVNRLVVVVVMGVAKSPKSSSSSSFISPLRLTFNARVVRTDTGDATAVVDCRSLFQSPSRALGGRSIGRVDRPIEAPHSSSSSSSSFVCACDVEACCAS